MSTAADDSIRILREDDPEHNSLLAAGWRVAATSWGARLELGEDADLTALLDAVAAAQDAGYTLRRLTPEDEAALRALDEQVGPDFPDTAASHHDPLPQEVGAWMSDGSWLVLGAFDGERIIGLSTSCAQDDRWETERTAVASEHRGRGVAKALKATTVLTTYARGARRWGTGGAGGNAASLAMNRSLGFELEPLWHTLKAPGR